MVRNISGSRKAISLIGLIILAVAAIVSFYVVLGPASVSAGGGPESGEKVFEGSFGIKVEPIKAVLTVVEGRTYAMDPGEKAKAELRITNTSRSTPWVVSVFLEVGPTVGKFYTGSLVTLDAKWDDGAIFVKHDVFALKAGQTRVLSISLEALDGVGETFVKAFVHRLEPYVAGEGVNTSGGDVSGLNFTADAIAGSH